MTAVSGVHMFSRIKYVHSLLYLGRLFKTYVHFVPIVISSFTEANAELKAACNSCISTIMESISQHCSFLDFTQYSWIFAGNFMEN